MEFVHNRPSPAGAAPAAAGVALPLDSPPRLALAVDSEELQPEPVVGQEPAEDLEPEEQLPEGGEDFVVDPPPPAHPPEDEPAADQVLEAGSRAEAVAD